MTISKKFAKAVHLKDVHLAQGMQCGDCHFDVDVHGTDALWRSPHCNALREMPSFKCTGLRELLRIVIVDLVVVEIEQVALRSCLKIARKTSRVRDNRELGVLKLRIQFRDLVEKSFVAPKSARSGGLGIFHCRSDELSIRRIVLFLRIHQLAVRFLVPPGVTEIRVHEKISLMHVAVHALARRNRPRELVHDRMAALGFLESIRRQ